MIYVSKDMFDNYKAEKSQGSEKIFIFPESNRINKRRP